MSRFLVGFAVGALLTTTVTSASDFSKLGEPAFARSVLVGYQRQLEATCASIAIYRPKVVGNVAPADARIMGELVVQRLIEEIGSEKEARELIGDRPGWFDGYEYDSAESRRLKAETLALYAQKCAPLIDAYRTGGQAALEAKLLPSRGLIPLLSVPRCIALIEYTTPRDPYPMFDKEQLVEMNELAHHGLSTSDSKTLDAAIAVERAELAKTQPAIEEVGREPIACLATFRQRAQEAYPERF